MGERSPNIVQNETLTVVEAGPDVPLLPLDLISFNLHTALIIVATCTFGAQVQI